MRLLSVPLLAVFCLSFFSSKAQTVINQKKSTTKYAFSITAKKLEYGYEALNIKIKKKSDGTVIQTINKPVEDAFEYDMPLFVSVADVNFDGYQDFFFPDYSSRNTLYSIYLFDPKVQKFVKSEVLEKAVGVNLVVDSKNKILQTSSISSVANSEYAKYTIINATIIPLESGSTELKQIGSNDYLVEKSYWYDYDAATGKSFVVKQRIVDAEEVNGKGYTVEKHFVKKEGSSDMRLLKQVRYSAGTGSPQDYNYDISKILKLKSLDSLFIVYKGMVNVSYQPEVAEYEVPEGFTYTLFANTPSELNIVVTKDGKLHELFANAAKGSKWRFPHGLKTGMSLQELAALNSKPVNIAGFETDYGGQVSWNGGTLAKKNISVKMGYAGNIPQEFIGDNANIRSDNPKLKGLKLFVQRISIGNE